MGKQCVKAWNYRTQGTCSASPRANAGRFYGDAFSFWMFDALVLPWFYFEVKIEAGNKDQKF